jgi:L-lactate utilization protein LutB
MLQKDTMNQDLPIWIMEPELAEKGGLAATKLFKARHNAAPASETISIEDIKQRLREIRQYTLNNANSLAEELKTTLSENYPGVKVKLAVDNADAVTYITEISDGASTVSTNNSSIVTQELKPLLIDNGFMVINSYLDEFDIKERKLPDYWELPPLFDRNLRGTFDVSVKMSGLPDIETKKYLAVLGVNAVAADDGTAFFLQHFSNIAKDLRLANKVILVIGLDKIVKTRQEATFQTRCTGIFGMDNVLPGIGGQPREILAIDELPLPRGNTERELHLIILDNGRTGLLQGKFRDLFLCIGCRACNKHCPIRYALSNGDYIWTPRNYLNHFLYGNSNSIDVCLHCEACRIECPVNIDLPYLMWQAKMDYVAQRGRPFKHRLLGRPETLAKLGTTFAPISNWLLGLKPARIPMEIISGIDRRTRLPKFRAQTFRQWFRQHG